jgi:hypothetical protein
MDGVAREAANRPPGASDSRAIKPALAQVSDRLNPAKRTAISKLPETAGS